MSEARPLTFEYVAQRFKQRPGITATDMLLLSIPVGELKKWAGVPRKTFNYQQGFQRTLAEKRIEEIATYFTDDPANVSPTAVVVGFNKNAPGVDVSALKGPEGIDLVKLKITVRDLDAEPLEALLPLGLKALEARLPAEAVALVQGDVQKALDVALTADAESEDDELNTGAEAALDEPNRSYLADFYAELLGFEQGLAPIPDPDKLRQILHSLLKPAMIVDGQHRVFGAAHADESIAVPVCALLASDWPSSVYQFVVINQKAKPIKPAFLSSIIATSLTDSEIEAVYDRLRTSHIDVERAETMEFVNSDPESPFRGMVDFEVEGAPGFLQFPGLAKLVADFRNIPRSHPPLVGSSKWEGTWLRHFFGFWSGIRDYFVSRDPRLWQPPSESNPNNLLKIVTLQEVQRLVLDTWADGRQFRFKKTRTTKKAAADFWNDFPPTFFTDEWRKKGLQTSVGRDILRNAMTETRRNIGKKGWGHRRLGLFQE